MGLTDPQGALLQQYDYDPYGTPTAIDTLGNFGHNRLGHQGLFADRYDTDAPAADLAVDADLMYYARNRDYRPDLGRWVQRDPNGSSSTVLNGAEYYAVPLGLSPSPMDVLGMFRDGVNLFAAMANGPITSTDPLGLFAGLDVSASNSLRSGLNAYGKADAAKGVLDIVQAVASGATITSALVGLAADYAVDKAGGKLFEKVLESSKSFRKAIANGDVPHSPPDAALRGRFDTYVYLGYHVETNQLAYVGVTDNVPRRSRQHADRDFEIGMTFGPFPRLMSRALEQAFIVRRGMQKRGGELQNRRQEIAQSREIYDELVTQWAIPMVDALGFGK